LLQSLQQQEVLLDALQPEENAVGEAGNSEFTCFEKMGRCVCSHFATSSRDGVY
jgi:hypothetical protein